MKPGVSKYPLVRIAPCKWCGKLGEQEIKNHMKINKKHFCDDIFRRASWDKSHMKDGRRSDRAKKPLKAAEPEKPQHLPKTKPSKSIFDLGSRAYSSSRCPAKKVISPRISQNIPASLEVRDAEYWRCLRVSFGLQSAARVAV